MFSQMMKPVSHLPVLVLKDRHAVLQKGNALKPENKPATKYFDKLVISNSSGTSIVELDKIIRLESDNNYTSIFTTDHKKPLLVSKTLKHFERILTDTCFIRIHQSHIVNAKKIVQYTTQKQAIVRLTNNEEIAVSRSRRSVIKKYLLNNNYI